MPSKNSSLTDNRTDPELGQGKENGSERYPQVVGDFSAKSKNEEKIYTSIVSREEGIEKKISDGKNLNRRDVQKYDNAITRMSTRVVNPMANEKKPGSREDKERFRKLQSGKLELMENYRQAISSNDYSKAYGLLKGLRSNYIDRLDIYARGVGIFEHPPQGTKAPSSATSTSQSSTAERVPSTTYKVVFRYSPTKPKTKTKPRGARERAHHFFDERRRNEARQFKNQVISGGSFTYSPESVALMQTDGVLASNYSSGDINPAISAAAHGIDISSYMEKVEAFNGGDLPVKELGASLNNSVDALQNLYLGDEYLYAGLRDVNQGNQLTGIEIVQDSDIKSQKGQLVFDYSPTEGFRPIMDIARPLTNKAKGKVKEKVGGLLKKGAKKIGKKAGMEAFERLSGQAVEKAVTVLAAELGPLAPIIGKLAGWLYRKIVSKALIAAKKYGKYLLGAGLGLAGMGLMASSPFLVLGGLGLASLGGLAGGTAAVAGTLTGLSAFLPLLISTAVVSFAATLLVAIIVTPIIIALIIFIITTGAYIVPGLPGSGSYTCTAQLTNLGIFTNGGGRALEYVIQTNPDVVVHFNNYELANQTGTGTIDVGRSWDAFPDDDMLDLTPDEVISRLTNLMREYPQIDVWQAYNEPLFHGASWDWLTSRDLAVIQAGSQNGKDVCIGNFKEGFPQDPTSSEFTSYAQAITEAADGANIDVYLCVHEHETAANWEFNARYNGRFSQLISNGLDLPVIVTVAGFDSEAGESDSGVGWQGIIEPADYVDMLLDYQSAAKAAGAVGVAVFQLGLSGRWESYDITPLMDLAVDCETTSEFPGGIDPSEYLDVTKIAREEGSGDPGPFDNNELPLEIEYTVTLRVQDETVSNIRFSDSCTVTQESGSSACPNTDPEITSPDPDLELAPSETYEFIYRRGVDSQHEDAWVGDTFRVLFDTTSERNLQSYASAMIKIGDPPDFCPSDWPLPTNVTYRFTQGAYGSYSHFNSEAIDISRAGITGTDVYTTHSGLVEVGYDAVGFGRYVKIISTCEGRPFYSLYAHLNTVTTEPGTIEKGEKIGEVGGTGGWAPHLHYEFKYSSTNPTGGRGNSWIGRPPYMMVSQEGTYGAPFYVPKDLPRECTTYAGCGSTNIP